MSSIFSDIILERDRIDRRLAVDADASLHNNTPPDRADDRLSQADDALRYILDRFGVTAERVSRCASVNELLDRTLDPLCITYEARELRGKDWRRDGLAMLGFLADGSAVALLPSLAGYRYVCPATGKSGHVGRAVKLDSTAYVIYRPLPEDCHTLGRLARFVLSLLSPGDRVPITLCAAVISLLGLVFPALNQLVLERLVPMGAGAWPKLTAAAVLFFSIGLLRAAVTAVKSLTLGSMKLRLSAQVQAAVVSRVLFLPDAFFRNLSAGKMSRRIANSRTLADQLVSVALDTSVTTLFSLVYIPQMARFAPALYLPALLVLAAQLAVSVLASAAYAKNLLAANDLSMDEHGFVFTAIRSIQKLKTAGALKRVYAKWAELYRRMLVYTLDPPALVKLRGVLTAFLSSLGSVLIISLAASTGVARADYIAFTASYGLIVAAFTELMSVISSCFTLPPLLESLRPLLEAEPEITYAQQYIKKLSGTIQLEDLHFAYRDAREECIRGVSLHIGKGEKVAIVGESGCGKSTLLRLIAGMETPSSGCVYFDGQPLPSPNKRSLRRRIGSVFQFSQVLPGSLRSNIAFNAPDIPEEDIWAAAETAQVAQLIRSLPLGLDTDVSESRGGGFSGGQRQCILLARALASKPSVLVLDEATSALDNVTQKKVLDAISDLNATVIMVAHRLSTVRQCDRIVMLDGGVIAEEGTYDELMAKDGLFAALVRKQLSAPPRPNRPGRRRPPRSDLS